MDVRARFATPNIVYLEAFEGNTEMGYLAYDVVNCTILDMHSTVTGSHVAFTLLDHAYERWGPLMDPNLEYEIVDNSFSCGEVRSSTLTPAGLKVAETWIARRKARGLHPSAR